MRKPLQLLIALVLSIMISLGWSEDNSISTAPGKQPLLVKTKQQAFRSAKKYIGRLVMIGRLDDSWLQARPETASRTSYKGRPEWKVSYVNPAVKEKSKRTVYIFLDDYGHYTGSNYTGD